MFTLALEKRERERKGEREKVKRQREKERNGSSRDTVERPGRNEIVSGKLNSCISLFTLKFESSFIPKLNFKNV